MTSLEQNGTASANSALRGRPDSKTDMHEALEPNKTPAGSSATKATTC
jgi:hypothetical protein